MFSVCSIPYIEQLTECTLCSSTFKNPLILSCGHTFCKFCIIRNTKSGVFKCNICDTEHEILDGNVDKAFEKNNLAEFFVNYRMDNFSQKRLQVSLFDVSVIEGICPICNPDIKKEQAKEKNIKTVKISKCFHCKRVICLNCKTRHYNAMKIELIKNLDRIKESIINLEIVRQRLDEARRKKLSEYEQMKIRVALKCREIEDKLNEEKNRKIDEINAEIEKDKSNIKFTEISSSQMDCVKITADEMVTNIFSETSAKRLTTFCVSFSKIQKDWHDFLRKEANLSDPDNENKLIFHPFNAPNKILGTTIVTKYETKIKQPLLLKENSSICVIS